MSIAKAQILRYNWDVQKHILMKVKVKHNSRVKTHLYLMEQGENCFAKKKSFRKHLTNCITWTVIEINCFLASKTL